MAGTLQQQQQQQQQQQHPPVRTHFKTPEGRYKLSREKTHPTGMLHYSSHRGPSMLTVAHLKDKPHMSSSTSSHSSTAPTSSLSALTNVGSRFVPKGLFSGTTATPPTSTPVNGTSASSSLLSNGKSSSYTGSLFAAAGFVRSKSSSLPASAPGANSTSSGSSTSSNTAHGASGNGAASNGGASPASASDEATYLIFNIGEALFISDYSTPDKDPIKSIQFEKTRSLRHAFNHDATDGHDLAVGNEAGEVFTLSLRTQLQDPNRKPLGNTHFNINGTMCNSRVTCIIWVPRSDSLFLVAHGDGNIFVYDKTRDATGAEGHFPVVKDVNAFCVAKSRASKSNPVARWHISSGAVNDITFSADGLLMATVGRDGYLRVFDWKQETLLYGFKCYYGALLCCAFSPDSKLVVAGGEDDLVHVWSLEDQRLVAWGEGHGSWLSTVAFDPWWTAPGQLAGEGSPTAYRIGSVGQDSQLLLWDLRVDEVVLPLRWQQQQQAGSSGALSARPSLDLGQGAQHPHSTSSPARRVVGVLQPAPLSKDVPRLTAIMAHQLHTEPLSDLAFFKDAIVTIDYEGQIKIWSRPSAETVATPGALGGATVTSPSPALGASSSVPPGARVEAPAPLANGIGRGLDAMRGESNKGMSRQRIPLS
eukprot:TRINITY_DN1672_c0_g1_i1.p1 TRINITY_DN1672_c0_g1~~TRINITY_DN1672_c0_g1_i1.p1  ORF type:complete len:647 (+),score=111.38 TRINITY_DN1672_c0_g1_i1:968-2908(+)